MEHSVDADHGVLPRSTPVAAAGEAKQGDVCDPERAGSPGRRDHPRGVTLTTPTANATQGGAAGDPPGGAAGTTRLTSPQRRPVRGVTTATPSTEGGMAPQKLAFNTPKMVNPLTVRAGRIGPTGESISVNGPRAVNEPAGEDDTGAAATSSPPSVRAPRPARRAAQRETWCFEADGRCQCSNGCSCGLLLAILLVTVLYFAMHCTSIVGDLVKKKSPAGGLVLRRRSKSYAG